MKPSSKHIGPFLAFDLAWFARHQRGLLWLLNAPVVRVWFRWILRIHRDIPTTERIVEIRPNSFTFGVNEFSDGRLELTTDFRSHPKFAKRIYFAFRPLWWVLHCWDWLVADRMAPELSFGFDSLTAYPASGASSPVDGYVGRNNVNETFATITSSAGNEDDETLQTIDCILIASSTTNQYFRLWRGIVCFDTSALTASASISAAVLSLFGDAVVNDLGSPALHICGATPASTSALANSDYGQLGSTSFANIAYGSFSASSYNDFTLDSNGRANVSLTGVSQFGVRLSWDITGTFSGAWVSGVFSRMRFVSADLSGTSADPKLVITYTLVDPETFPAGYASRRHNSLLRM